MKTSIASAASTTQWIPCAKITQRHGILACLCGGLIGFALSTNAQTPIVCGQAVSNAITSPVGIAQYRYAGVTGEKLLFSFVGYGNCFSFGNNAVMELYDPANQLIATLSHCGVRSTNLTLLTNGNYAIRVHDSTFSSTTPSFYLAVQSFIGGGCASTPIVCGQSIAGAIDFPTKTDAYNYVGNAGEKVLFSFAGYGNCFSFGNDALMEIYNPAGEKIVTLNHCNTRSTNLTLPANGTYTILVHDRDYASSTPTYSISVQSYVGGGCGGTPVVCGQTISTNIGPTTESGAYIYNGIAGEKVLFSFAGYGNCFSFGNNAVLDLYNPAGQKIMALTHCGIRATNLTLPVSGTYTILVHDSDYLSSTPTYSLSVQSYVAGGCNSTPIVCGQTITGSLGPTTRSDAYTYEGNTGDKVLLSFAGYGNCFSFGNDAVLDLYNPAGQKIVTLNHCNVRATNLTLPTNGTYTILVHDRDYLSSTPSYSLSVESFVGGGCASTLVSPGQIVNGALTETTRSDAYAYFGTAGEPLLFNFLGYGNCFSFGNDAVLDIYNPAGQKFVSLNHCGIRTTNLTLPSSGLYTILVHDSAYVSSTPDYTFTAISLTSYPFQIVAVPTNQTVMVGRRVAFTVIVQGTPPITYQWRYNGANLAGETNATFVIPSAHPTNSGIYSVVVQEEGGQAITTPPAQLTVLAPLYPFSDSFAGRVITNSFSGIVRGSNIHASLEPREPMHALKPGGRSVWFGWVAPGTGVATFHTRGSSFDTLLAVYSGTLISNLNEIASDDDAGRFFTSEVRFNAAAGVQHAIAIDGLGGAAGDIVLNWSLDTNAPPVPIILRQPGNRIAPGGGSATFTVIATNATSIQWFFNGALIKGATNSSLTISNVTFSSVGVYTVRAANGPQFVLSAPAVLEIGPPTVTPTVEKFEELFSSNNLAVSTIASDVLTAADKARPRIVSVAAGSIRTANLGGSTQLLEPNHGGGLGGASRWQLFQYSTDGVLLITVRATNVPASLATYTGDSLATLTLVTQDEAPASGATATNLFRVQANVRYPVAMDTRGGIATQFELNWNFVSAPQLTSDDRVQVSPGGDALLSVNVQGGIGGLTYQWLRGSNAIPDATQPTLLLTNVQNDAPGIYVLKVSYLGFVIAERSIEVVILGALPAIVDEPNDFNGISGQPGGFSGVVLASEPVSYQWYKQDSRGQFKAVRGATNTSYTIEKLTTKSGGFFQLIATNNSGSVTSRAAQLTVYLAVAIKTQPKDINTVAGRKVSLKAKATGTALRYQWYFNDAPVMNATAPTLVITNVQPENAGTYYLVVSNIVSITNSRVATLTLPSPPNALATKSISAESGVHTSMEKKGDEVRLSITAPRGRYEVLVSSDLREWHVAGELEITSGPASFIHRTTAAVSFYRLQRITTHP